MAHRHDIDAFPSKLAWLEEFFVLNTRATNAQAHKALKATAGSSVSETTMVSARATAHERLAKPSVLDLCARLQAAMRREGVTKLTLDWARPPEISALLAAEKRILSHLELRPQTLPELQESLGYEPRALIAALRRMRHLLVPTRIPGGETLYRLASVDFPPHGAPIEPDAS